jgi:hypothetical protein
MNHLPLHRALLLCACAVLPLASSCRSVAVSTERDPSVDFSHFKSFDWLSVPQGTQAELAGTSMLDLLDEMLVEHGLEHRSDHPDLLVEVHRSVAGTVNVASWGVDHEQMQEVTLTIDLVDRHTQRSVWRGTASGTFPISTDPEERAQRRLQVLHRMFADFPPSG